MKRNFGKSCSVSAWKTNICFFYADGCQTSRGTNAFDRHHMYDMMHTYMWHDKFMCDMDPVVHMWHDPFPNAFKWHHTFDMTNAYICDMTHSCETSYICDMNHSLMYSNGIIHATWRIHICEVIHSCVTSYRPLTEEIRLTIFWFPDLSVFLIDLLNVGDSVYSGKQLWNFGGSRENLFEIHRDSRENLLKFWQS